MFIVAVFLHAPVIDFAAPVQAEGKIIGIATSIDIAVHVARRVLGLQFHCLHVGWHLERQQCIRFGLSCDDVKYCLVLDTECHEDSIAIWLDFAHHQRVGAVHHHYHWLVAHLLACLFHELHVAPVDSAHSLALIAAVGCRFKWVAASQAHLACIFSNVVRILEADRVVAVLRLNHLLALWLEVDVVFRDNLVDRSIEWNILIVSLVVCCYGLFLQCWVRESFAHLVAPARCWRVDEDDGNVGITGSGSMLEVFASYLR